MPAKRKRTTQPQPPGSRSREDRVIKASLKKLQPFLERVRRGSLNKEPILHSCVKASFAKAFEFANFAHRGLREEHAFHCVGALRSICEDLIVLKFVSTLAEDHQKDLLLSDMAQTVDDSIQRQARFFATFRLGQPVLNTGYPAAALAKYNEDVIAIWRANGWPRKKTPAWPQTLQIAQRVGPGTLDVMYDYFYRLTSATVHFNTGALLRTGWGPNKSEFIFSTAHMGPYYAQFCRVYGAFLLSVYFEFFGAILEVDDVSNAETRAIRNSLLMRDRWPEMVTFEEMNLKLPKKHFLSVVFQAVLATELESGFISGAEKLAAEKLANGSGASS